MEGITSFLGGMFKLATASMGSATAVASVAPKAVTGTVKNIENFEAAVGEVEELVSDVEKGVYKDIPEDVTKLVKRGQSILKNYGVEIPGLAHVVAMLPTTPSVATLTAAKKVL